MSFDDQTQMSDFEIIKKLGEGSFSQVYKVKRKSDGKEYAMKKIKFNMLKSKEKDNALNEVRILASINDPNIIGYKETFFDNESSCLCIILEFAGGGDLLNFIRTAMNKKSFIPEATVWTYFIQLLKGLKTLHQLKILHRDLKCANIFLSTDQAHVKLGDLNVSKIAKRGLVYTQTGTPYYASPEVWRDEPYDQKSDIWSLGCVIYELCSQRPPFKAANMEGLYKKIQRGVYDKLPSVYSQDLNTIISLCLKISSQMRPNCEELLQNHLVLRRMKESDKVEIKKQQKIDLLNTIKLPLNIKNLKNSLPKAKYDQTNNKSFLQPSPSVKCDSIKLQEIFPIKRSNSVLSRNKVDVQPSKCVVRNSSESNLHQNNNQPQLKRQPSPANAPLLPQPLCVKKSTERYDPSNYVPAPLPPGKKMNARKPLNDILQAQVILRNQLDRNVMPSKINISNNYGIDRSYNNYKDAIENQRPHQHNNSIILKKIDGCRNNSQDRIDCSLKLIQNSQLPISRYCPIIRRPSFNQENKVPNIIDAGRPSDIFKPMQCAARHILDNHPGGLVPRNNFY